MRKKVMSMKRDGNKKQGANLAPEAFKLRNVYCWYVGGNMFTYRAKYGKYWLYGNLDEWLMLYDKCPPSPFNDDAYDAFFADNSHMVQPDIAYPTWQQILDSLSNAVHIESYTFSAQDAINEWQDLSKPINWDWD